MPRMEMVFGDDEVNGCNETAAKMVDDIIEREEGDIIVDGKVDEMLAEMAAKGIFVAAMHPKNDTLQSVLMNNLLMIKLGRELQRRGIDAIIENETKNLDLDSELKNLLGDGDEKQSPKHRDFGKDDGLSGGYL